MRILRVIRSVNPNGGGPIEGLLQSSNVLAAMGHGIEIASLDVPSVDFAKTISFPLFLLGSGNSSYGYSKKLDQWLNNNIKNYDCIIVHGIWQYHSLAVRNACVKKGIPYYVFTHGMLDPWFKQQYPIKHIKKWLYWPWGDYRVLRDASAVFFTSEQEKILARKSFWLYSCNEVVVNYGTSLPKGDLASQRDLFLEQFKELKGKKFFLFLSRIHPKKGCDILIEAFAEACKKNNEIYLVMAGPDQINWRSALEDLAEKLGVAHRLIWTGMLSGDMKWGAYYSADVFILPSHQENFGIVVAEALACKLPVLISNKVNIWKEIEEDCAGVVAEDTFAGVQKMIGKWINMPDDEKNEMRKNAGNCFKSRFEVSQAAKGLLKNLQ